MSIDKATESFLQTLSSDASMQSALKAELGRAQQPLDAVFAFAKERGFAVERSSLEAAHRALTQELDDSALDQVAGGFNPQPEPPALIGSNYQYNFDQQILWGW